MSLPVTSLRLEPLKQEGTTKGLPKGLFKLLRKIMSQMHPQTVQSESYGSGQAVLTSHH